MIINCNGATFEHAGVTYTIGASVVGTDQSEYEGLTGYIYEVRDGADKETENETPDLYCNFDPPDDPAEVAKTFFTALSVIPCDVAHHQKNQKNGGIVCNAVSLHTTA